ncbi:MAG: 23S rRNA pseudouridine(2604) synthase RluF, partial [Vibrio fluvialis]
NQTSKARRNPKTFRGHNADEFRHAPNSKKGKGRTDRSEHSRTERKPKTFVSHAAGKPNGKPAADRKGGTLSLKK